MDFFIVFIIGLLFFCLVVLIRRINNNNLVVVKVKEHLSPYQKDKSIKLIEERIDREGVNTICFGLTGISIITMIVGIVGLIVV